MITEQKGKTRADLVFAAFRPTLGQVTKAGAPLISEQCRSPQALRFNLYKSSSSKRAVFQQLNLIEKLKSLRTRHE